jgi:hypothetical protein
MILRLLISLLLTLGWTGTAAANTSQAQIGPDYQTEWLHSAKPETRAYAYDLNIIKNAPQVIQALLSLQLSTKLSQSLYRQYGSGSPVSPVRQKALNILYPSEDTPYCSLA